METLRAMEMFVEAVEQGSFAAAARSLGVGNSAVSKQISQLEETLGVRLLQRTTRSLSLTAEGDYYLEECREILEQVDAARDTVSALADQTGGTLSVSAPPTFGQLWLSSILCQFREAYPEIEFEVLLTDEILDVVSDSFDVAIREGNPEDSSLIGRRLADNTYRVCAAPSYLERAGRPENPSDLTEHACITSLEHAPLKKWRFTRGDETVTVDVSGPIATNLFTLMRRAALEGQGIVRLPSYAVERYIASGELVALFEDQVPDHGGIWALYPSRRLVPNRVETFLEFLQTKMREDAAPGDR
jgi:DNA-binding transcriptional LysR family regulator